MSSLVISRIGLDIHAHSGKPNMSPGIPQAISLTLSNGVIEDMIQCVRNGKSIELSLDSQPSISYGNTTQNLEAEDNASPHEIIRSSLQNAARPLSKAIAPHPPPNSIAGSKSISTIAALLSRKFTCLHAPVINSPTSEAFAAENIKESATASTDAALAALQSSLATESMRKAENTVKYIKDGTLAVPSKRGGVLRSSISNNARSQKNQRLDVSVKNLPLSPALSSESIPLSQRQAEKAKAARKPVIHLLAISPLTEEALKSTIPSYAANGLQEALQKVGDLNEVTGKWELRKAFYKELDVWSFKYEVSDDRQRAIDNAVKIFDKMRLNVSEPQWENLLEPKERGSGKCLSKLQAQIAQESSHKAPKNATNQGLDLPQTNGSKDDSMGDRTGAKTNGDSIVRTASSQNPMTAKLKKMKKEKEAQAKWLLSKKPTSSGKPAVVKPAVIKKNQLVGKDAKPAPVTALSSEFVDSSNEEETSPTEPMVSKARKRPRVNDDIDAKELNVSPAKKVSLNRPTVVHRMPEVSRLKNTGQYTFSSKQAKSTSPRKSSPLASSPPTNASDFELSDSNSPSSATSLQPHSSTTSQSPIYKSRSNTTSSQRKTSNNSSRRLRPEVTDLARKFKMYYPKYLELHEQLTGMGDRRDRRLEKDLLDMHARLVTMKREIFAGIVDVSVG